jgi:integrase
MITGITLHSYRYAWAERARTCGYPERFAQEALGHKSKAVHRAYTRKAQVVIPTLEEYERKLAASVDGVIVPMRLAVNQ